MSATPTIRLATGEDAGSVARMLRALAEELGDAAEFASTDETIRTHGFGQEPSFTALIAETSQGHCGLALFFRHFSTTRGQRGVFVQDLWVEPALRGAGLGKRLLAATARHAARVWGAAYLVLTVHRDNPGAARLYRRLGFVDLPNDAPMSLGGAGFNRLAESGS